jgi:hypothetical protein
MMLVNMWVLRAAESGAPPNVCVDACQTLRYALGQFAIGAELAAVDLVVDDPGRGTTVHGTPEPSWDGTGLDGHCILWLPRWRRFIDPTVTQYADAARLGLGPVMGRMDAVTGPAEQAVALAEGQALPEGAHFAVPRGNGMLLYTVASQEATGVITSNPWIVQHADIHRHAGINLASYALEALRRPPAVGIAKAAPFPRVAALLDAIGDAPSETDEAGDWYFSVPAPDGGSQRLRLDQIPVPDGTPSERVCRMLGTHRPGRVHRPDAHRQRAVPACRPGSLRRALQPPSPAPGQEPAATGLRPERSGREHQPGGDRHSPAEGSRRADQRIRTGSVKITG